MLHETLILNFKASSSASSLRGHDCAATSDKLRFLTETRAIPMPKPPQMNNHGNYIISLNQFCQWLGDRAEELGVEVYPGFAASEVL